MLYKSGLGSEFQAAVCINSSSKANVANSVKVILKAILRKFNSDWWQKKWWMICHFKKHDNSYQTELKLREKNHQLWSITSPAVHYFSPFSSLGFSLDLCLGEGVALFRHIKSKESKQ